MANQKIVPLIKGVIKHLPFAKTLLKNKTGGTIESRYCYSVWMRHLENWNTANENIPRVVAELGPGDSLGVGLAALLSGAEKIYALDVIKYWDNERNIKIFDELVLLFQKRAPIPGKNEYPLIRPEIENYNFPSDILTEARLQRSLSPERIQLIRKEILNIENPANRFIKLQIPWYRSDIVEQNSVDFIFSQAVLQHVEDLEHTFKSMYEWLKPGGLMSHTVDFKSMGITPGWNGHWTFSDFEWKVVKGGVKGGNSFLINRLPYTSHLGFHNKYHFNVLKKSFVKMKNDLSLKKLAKRFMNLTEDELTTSGMYILSRKDLVISRLVSTFDLELENAVSA
jgi:SAM-dependent methyltransferase